MTINTVVRMNYNGVFYENAVTGTPNYNNTFYVTPIMELFTMNPAVDNHELELIEFMLGPSEKYYRVGFSVSQWYSENIVNNSGIWDLDPTMLYYKLNRSVDTGIPVLFHMNGGNWGAYGMGNDLLMKLWLNDSNCQWDQFNIVPNANLADPPLRNRLFSLQRDTEFNQYRQRFVTQSGQILYQFMQDHPDLFVGCSLDSEIHLDPDNTNDTIRYYDYNPLVIAEYRQWLASKYTIEQYNSRFGQSSVSFDVVDAPRDPTVNKSLFEEWTSFRHHLVQQCVELQAKWLYDCGIPKNKIFSHQILSEPGDYGSYYKRCDILETAVSEYGVVGVTRYNLIDPSVFWSINKVSGTDWGLFEWNIWHYHKPSDYYLYTMQLKAMYQAGAHVICPNGWFEYYNPQLMIRNNTYFIQALRDFGASIKNAPRTTVDAGKLNFIDYLYMDVVTISDYLDRRVWILAIPFGVVFLACIPIEIFKKKHIN